MLCNSKIVWGQSNLNEQNQKWLQEAEKSFENKQFDKSLGLWGRVYRSGYFSEKMLYQMASAHEAKGDFPESIYYLRKAEQEYGRKPIDTKVSRLKEKMGRRTLFPAERLHFWHREVASWKWAILSGMGACLGFAVLLALWKSQVVGQAVRRAVGILLCWAAIGLGAVWIHHQYAAPQRAVLMTYTSYYEAAGYASERLSLPLSPGTTVVIKEKHDIWRKIALGRIHCWVPHFTLKEL